MTKKQYVDQYIFPINHRATENWEKSALQNAWENAKLKGFTSCQAMTFLYQDGITDTIGFAVVTGEYVDGI